ncbi:MAG: ribonuclease III [Sphaerochaetaceae bacterium]|nr:ribonuclease III [Sphaerochaetaceae bacterium]
MNFSFKKTNKAPFIPEDRKRELLLFQKNAGISLNNLSLLDNAFTHSSYANEAKSSGIKDNERLEFLGDSVLSVVVSGYLYENTSGDEGEYTKIRSYVVSEDSLSEIAHKLNVDKYILIGKGEELTGGRNKKAILADCMEAIFAAVYIDKGFDYIKTFILKLLVPQINEVLSNKHKKDYKTMLQEYVQKKYKKVPKYTLIKTEGPEHDQVFYYMVEFQGKQFGPAGGKNKKEAEQNVAKLCWTELNPDK